MTTVSQTTGDHGEIRVDVLTLGDGNIQCDFYIRSTSVVSANITYSWKLDTDAATNESFSFQPTTVWQYMRSVPATNREQVTLHLNSTGTAQLGGPTDLVVDLTAALAPTAPTKDGNTYTLPTGDHGVLRVDDNTSTTSKSCDLYIRSFSVVATNLRWGWAVNDNPIALHTFDFADTTLWQKLGTVYVGHARSFKLHLGATGTAQLGGPTDLVFDLAAGQTTVFVKVGTEWKSANAFVKDAGVWKPANVLVHQGGDWVQAN